MLGIGGVHALEAVGLSPDRLPHERGALGLPRARAHRPRHARAWSALRSGDRGRTAPATSSPRTPRCPPATTPSRPSSCAATSSPIAPRSGSARTSSSALGREDPRDRAGKFSMPVLAIRAADHYNGVSELHGEVSRKMWRGLWPDLPEHEIPIDFITNGVHTPSWIASEMGALFTRYLGPRWAEHARRRGALGARVRDPRRRAVAGSRAPPASPRAACAPLAAHERPSGRGAATTRSTLADEVLDPRALTIGFARRFATYKRASAAVQRSGAREEAPGRHATAGAARLRRQGAPAGQGRQGADPRDRPRQPRRGLPRARRLRRGLRHAHRARAGLRRRRVAQHAAPPARGERARAA